jgi:hypothetical protein
LAGEPENGLLSAMNFGSLLRGWIDSSVKSTSHWPIGQKNRIDSTKNADF